MAVRKLLLVDDDVDLREGLADQLALYEEFAVEQHGCAADALEFLKDNQVDMMLLDVGLPDMDGRELCKRIRKNGVSVPILMLTGNVSDADTVLGLDAGANGLYHQAVQHHRIDGTPSALTSASMSKAKTPHSILAPTSPVLLAKCLRKRHPVKKYA